MSDNSSKNEINDKDDNLSITNQLTNFKIRIEEESNNELSKITKLINYFEKVSLEFNQLYLNFYENIENQNIPNEININNFFNSFYSFQNQIFERYKNISQIIIKEISPSLKRAKKIYERENKKNLSSLVDIIDQINLHQNVLDLIKNEYYDECKKLEDMEQNNKKINSNNNEEIMQKMANQTKNMENKFSLYKKEVEVMKKLCSDCERDFENIKQRFKENEIQKNNNLYTLIRNYLVYFVDDIKIINDKADKFQSLLDQKKSHFNNSLLINKIYESNIHWKYNFDITSSSQEKIIEDKNKINEPVDIKDEEDEDKEKNNNRPKRIEEMIIMPKNNYEIEGIDIIYMELNRSNYELIKKEDDEITKKFSSELLVIKDFFKTLFGKDIIQSEQKNILMNILEKYKGNINCYIKFCNKFLYSNKDSHQDMFEFQSFSNFAYFSGLLKNIIENISDNLLSNDINSYKLFDKIICIGEKTMYKDTYLCELLSSENQIFKRDIIWKNGIKNKLINLFEDICAKEYNQEKSKEGNYFRKSLGAFGKLFQKKDGRKESSDKKNNLIESYGLDKHIKLFKELSKQTIKKINENYGQNIIHEIIKCYIRHMINYNYLNNAEKKDSDLENIFNQILTDYLIKESNRLEFLKLYFHSYIHSIKKAKEISKIKLNNMIGYNSKNEKNILILKKCSKFLSSKDKINLIKLSHEYINLDKYIYHRFLKNDFNFNSKNRIGIWKILLKYEESIKKYDYKKIVEEINKVPINEKEGNNNLIMMDIKRTKFKMKNNNGEKILFNLLASLFYKKNKEQIIYCQGMNYIAAIFYDIVQNEEETFHLLKGFFVNAKYEIIFENKLGLLKEYFIIFEKLIFLFLPKIHQKLLINKIQANIFISPYFTTLFTNTYNYHPDNANKFLLNCIDDFILNGWSSLFSTLICVLKYFERKILSLKAEELIKFLVNDMGKNDLFSDDNFEEFYKLKKQFWINNDLLDKMLQEIKIEREIKIQFGLTDEQNNI